MRLLTFNEVSALVDRYTVINNTASTRILFHLCQAVSLSVPSFDRV
jgi:hypothetical protein